MSKRIWLPILLTAGAAHGAALTPDPPKSCESCVEWNQPQKPFRVFGNTWYVGTAGLAAILITSPQGHILIDGGLAQSAPLIADNIATAGFALGDVKLLLNSHAHYDHAGGLAALQRASGARVAASPESKRALEGGGPTADDPQYGFGHEHNDWAPVKPVKAIADKETLRVGDLAITARFTPGHTPGGTTWTWRSCEGDRCLDVVYADSLGSISAPGFKFTGDATHPRRDRAFGKSIDIVDKLPCDILLAPHPVMFEMDDKLKRVASGSPQNPFIDRWACSVYAAGARTRLTQRILQERSP